MAARWSGRPSRPPAVLVALALAALVVAFLPPVADLGYTVGYVGVVLGAAVVAGNHVVQHRRPLTSPAALVAAALVANALAEVVWNAQWWSTGVEPGIGPADVGFLGSYVLLVAALLRALRFAEGDGRRTDAVLDVATLLTVGVLVLSDLANQDAIAGPGEPLLSRLVLAAYPVLDAVLLVLAVRVAWHRWARTALGMPFALGLAGWLAADLAYATVVSVSPLLDLGWMLGALCLAWAVTGGTPDPERPRKVADDVRSTGDSATVVLLVAVLPLGVPTVLLVLHQLAGRPPPVWSIAAGTTVLLALAFARTHRILRRLELTGRDLEAARDAAEETSRATSAFLATMSHEIRTPMNGVAGLTTLLLDTELDDDQRGYARGVDTAASALLRVIDDVLDFSKIEAGKIEVEEVPFALRTVLDDVLAVAGLDPRAEGLALRVEVDPAVPGLLRGDPGRLRQVLLNLVSNAVKFTEHGEVVASARLEGGGGPSCSLVRVEVRDTGLGIEPEVRERLFDAFAQADSSTTRRFGGTGLGLAICRGLVDRLGGRIGVDSEPGRGSTFWFTVPLQAVPAGVGTDDPAAHPVAVDGSPREAARVLVAEDSEVNQLVAEGMLVRLGCRVDIAEDGVAALEALGRTAYDLVLMDCQMPHLDGYDATVALREREGDGRRTPVVAMTASVTAEERARCREVGMDDFVAKPVRLEALRAVVDRWAGVAAPVGPVGPVGPGDPVAAGSDR